MSLEDFARKHISTVKTRGLRPAIGEAGQEVAFKLMGKLDGPLRTPIWEYNWDICLILDACRVDLMEEVIDEYDWLPDHVNKKWSVGSASPEWISNTFDSTKVRETAYVTGNPFAERDPSEIIYLDPDVVPLSNSQLAYLDNVWVDQWNPEGPGFEVVEPDVITGRAMHAYEHADAERFIVHYMQPHMPFRSHPEWFDGWGGPKRFGDVQAQRDRDIWHKLKDGMFESDEFWSAYRDNLRWVLDEVERWVMQTDATILITSDHGNAMGEWGQWGHPPGVATPQLRWVPWMFVDGRGQGKLEYDVVGNPPVVKSATADTKERLTALGYV